MIRQEIINLLYTAIELAGDGGFNPFSEEELDAINAFLNNSGWHSDDETPVIPENEEDIWVYCIVYNAEEKYFSPMFVRYTKLLALGWVLPDDITVKWWCYPPKIN